MRTALAPDVFTASYDLLARAYLDGPGSLHPDALPGAVALVEAAGALDPAWAAAVDALVNATAAERARAAADHLACFGPPLPGRHVPPYGSVYLDGGLLWGRSTFEVLALYEAEDLAWDRRRSGQGGSPVRAPDHVGVEMAFLSVVSGNRGAARAGGPRAMRIRAVLTHLAAWLPGLREALEEKGAGEDAGRLTAWGLSVVRADLRRRDARPGDTVGHGRGEPPR